MLSAAVVGGLWLGFTSGSPAATPLPPGLAHRGLVVSASSNGTVVVSDPDGSSPQILRNFPLQTGSSDQALVAAADERFLMSGIHTLISANGSFPVPVDSNVLFSPFMTPVPTNPFAGGDRAVVVLEKGPTQPNSTVWLVLFSDGDTMPLGNADQATGDPQNLGAFVTIPVRTSPWVRGWQGSRADTSVELRDAQGTRLLATSASLNRDLATDPDRPVSLRIIPDPSGNQLAVVVDPIGNASDDDAVVVLDRSGRLLGVPNKMSGPARGSTPAWSQDGSALAYYTVTGRGAALGVWPIGGRAHMRVAPDPTAKFDGCVWSPDGSTVLCSTVSASPQWIFARAEGGRLIAIRAPVFGRTDPLPLRPVAWLPGSS